MYGVGRLDDVAFVGDVHGLAFLRGARESRRSRCYPRISPVESAFSLFRTCAFRISHFLL